MKTNGKLLNSYGILFILPSIVGTFIFIIIPILCSFLLSFTNWDLLGNITYAGINNYKEIFIEPIFVQILINTVVYALSVTFFAVIIPLATAAVINEKMWSELFVENKYHLADRITEFQDCLEKMKQAVLNDDRDTLEDIMRHATAQKLKWLMK